MNYLATSDRFVLDSPGGAFKIAWESARLMAERGHQAALLCGSLPTDPPPGICEVEGVLVLRYRTPQDRVLNPVEAQIAAAQRQLAEVLRGRKWDIVHSHLPASGLAAFRSCGATARLIATVHSPMVDEQRFNWSAQGWLGGLKAFLGLPILRSIEHELLASAERIHCLSHFTSERLAREHPDLDRQKLIVLPWWCERPPTGALDVAQARQALGWPAKKRVLLTVRRLTARMGLSVLIRAVGPLLAAHDAYLMIVGDGPERSSLERGIAEMGATSRIQLLGRLPDGDVDLAYMAADLFVLPTLALECFGLIVLEALGAGCPVVGTEVGAIPELLVDRSVSQLCRPGDVVALRSQVEAFLTERWRPASRSAIARYAQARFARNQLEQRYLQWITEA